MGNKNGKSHEQNRNSSGNSVYSDSNIYKEKSKTDTGKRTKKNQQKAKSLTYGHFPASGDNRSNSTTQYTDSNLVSSYKSQQSSIDAFTISTQQIRSVQNTPPLPTRRVTNSSSSGRLIYIANYDFHASKDTGELSFKKGDRLEIYDRRTYKDWWRAINLESQAVGYVPSNYISPFDDLTSHEWYFSDITRRDAERFLHQPHNAQGTFLIRQSDSFQGQYSLSLLDLNTEKHFHVKHYRIRRNAQGLFCITEKRCFSTLLELIDHYKTDMDGLCCKLTDPCQRVEPTLPGDRHGLLELDRNQLIREVLLGKGNYGEVYRGTYGQRQVAIKSMKTDNRNRASNVEKFIDEAKIMKDLLHKNIVRLYGVCTEEEPIFIVTEYMAHGSLLVLLREDQGKTIKFKTIIDYATQIALGMSYLEEKRYVHCDLAARNILVGECNIVKIGDFGLAKILQGDRMTVDREAQFPIKWTAPEAATKKEYTTKSDVWSFGILLYELITYGSNPYPGMSNNEALQSVLRGYRMHQPAECNDSYYKLMTICWHENAEDRPTFESLYTRLDDFGSLTEPNYRDT